MAPHSWCQLSVPYGTSRLGPLFRPWSRDIPRQGIQHNNRHNTKKKKNQSMRSTDNDNRYRRDGKYYIFSFGRQRWKRECFTIVKSFSRKENVVSFYRLFISFLAFLLFCSFGDFKKMGGRRRRKKKSSIVFWAMLLCRHVRRFDRSTSFGAGLCCMGGERDRERNWHRFTPAAVTPFGRSRPNRMKCLGAAAAVAGLCACGPPHRNVPGIVDVLSLLPSSFRRFSPMP